MTQAQIQHAAATVAQVRTASDQVHGLGPGATMPNSATKIVVSSGWGDRCSTFSGQHHITVTSRARIEVNATHGTTTVTTMPAPATRTRRDGTIPLADAPGGGGPSDEGPSDGPPRRRQRTLDSFLASSPASSTRSEISTRTERRVMRVMSSNE